MGIPFRIGIKDAAILSLTKGRYWKGLAAHLVHLAPKAAAVFLAVATGMVLVRRLPQLLPEFSGPSADGIRFLLSALTGREGVPIAPRFAGVAVLVALQVVIAGFLAVAVLSAAVLVIQPMTSGLRDWHRLNRDRKTPKIRNLFGVFRNGKYGHAVLTFTRRVIRLAPYFLLGSAVAAAASVFVALRYATAAKWLHGTPALPPDTFAGLAYPVILASFAGLAGFLPAWFRDYAYRPVPWILSALPGLSPRDVVRLSERMTRGHRLDLFLLDLSFAGWAVTSLLTCGTGLLFLAPYYEAVQAEAYARLAEEAEAAGWLVRRSRSTRTDPEASRTGSP